MDRYCKRLIEVDLPIKRISAHSRREKSIRHGHISTLHIWWARRPLAACRAVICAALWPDPADELCPPAFFDKARGEMLAWTSHDRQQNLSPESRVRFEKARQKPALFDDAVQLRSALLDFIADFANWDNSTVKVYLDTSRTLTQTAHEALGGTPGTRPLVVDPFAGGGSIPLEALRVGADAFASDLNPVAALLNKVVLEYVPKYGQRLANEVRKWGDWIKREAEKELAEFYPKDPDGATPIAYLWARTIQCEGPGCGAELPLMRSLWLSKNANRSVALKLVPSTKAKRVDFQIIVKQRGGWMDQADPKTKIENPKFDGTVKRGSGTCPCCGYTTPQSSVREQLKKKGGGANQARLIAVVRKTQGKSGVSFRGPNSSDARRISAAEERLIKKFRELIPHEPIRSKNQSDVGRMPLYGMVNYGALFTSRQLLTLLTLASSIQKLKTELPDDESTAVRLCVACALDKQVDYLSSLARWHTSGQFVNNTYG